MLKTFQGFIRKIAEFPYRLNRVERRLNELMVLQAQAEIRWVRQLDKVSGLQEVEWRVFSQWGEDGIIQYLIHKLNIKQQTFIEFGVENYRESNTRFLLINDRWKGLILDGSEKHIRTIEQDGLPWQYDLHYQAAFITTENINSLIADKGFSGPLGILSIDIDGNDYWVWKEINCIQPEIIIAEYNAAFGNERAITIPYNPTFVASQAHYSRQYFGASLKALDFLAKKNGYYFIGCTSAGNNAFFLHKKYRSIIPEEDVAMKFVWPHWRQAQNQDGELSNLSFSEAMTELKGLPVINVITGEQETI